MSRSLPRLTTEAVQPRRPQHCDNSPRNAVVSQDLNVDRSVTTTPHFTHLSLTSVKPCPSPHANYAGYHRSHPIDEGEDNLSQLAAANFPTPCC